MLHLASITLFTLSIIILIMPLTSNALYKKLNPKLAVKLAFLVSIIPLMLMTKYSLKSLSTHLCLLNTSPMTITTTTTMNQYSTLFTPAALVVTWSIMEFSQWYMKKTKLTKNFTKLMLTFLIAMMTLTTAGSLMQLLIGWEWVGVMSFLLINWWFSRSNANSAALQAIIYNRIGDIGLIFVMATLAIDQASWTTEQILATDTKTIFLSMGLIMAATGKSAQFLMHLWLPAAMEGPTPVSALLHSSTMVVAGIYLLAQLHPMIKSQLPLSVCLHLGTATSIYAATSALAQNDMKKIIALSTSSQLGLMMTAIGMNCPNLAILHMISHATFKATLFLAAGSIIHNTQNEQDIRKMGHMKTTLPITSTALTVNGLTLSGLPFLSGFYSKDTILETMLCSHLNSWTLLATLISTTMTTSYTLRMIISTTTKTPNHKPMVSFSEPNSPQTKPLIRLTLTTIAIGPTLITTMLDTTMTLTTFTKLIPVMAMATGTYLTLEFFNSHTSLNNKHNIVMLLNNLSFFKMLHRSIPNTSLNSSYLLPHQLTDLLWLEKSGPLTANKVNLTLSKMTSSQKGLMKNYLLSILITTALALAITTY
uniref:NADH-ubiquinone oxidoreductase chain 5 n=1 Tax=Pseudocalotes microlepis TaxID=1963763 RepID=A0A384TLM4_9SAUR|nr:NADH dehydrogenase subunit 5 [Pseudocalotes microlepis]AQU64364.1 NADH dehydrogenase subunit 5 [Pseudocalotes microlepis]QGN67007.1 NADH dehydrogenase subunit 5 [Pseudocalotes microlepis]